MSASIRWIDLTDDQKKVVYQIRNTESGRKNRKKWRENDKEMEQLYKDNEQRILQLEGLVNQLRNELQVPQNHSSSTRTKWYTDFIYDMIATIHYELPNFAVNILQGTMQTNIPMCISIGQSPSDLMSDGDMYDVAFTVTISIVLDTSLKLLC